MGLFAGDTLDGHWRLHTTAQRTPDEWSSALTAYLTQAGHSTQEVRAAIVASVAPAVTQSLCEGLTLATTRAPALVDGRSRLPIVLDVDEPLTVGADRIADAVAVMYLYGGPACVIDFGTATTFNAVTRDGEYLGGAITAGINLATEALFTHAAKLPRIDLQRPPSVIGRNTVHAMQAGMLFGYVSMVEGMVERFRKELAHEPSAAGANCQPGGDLPAPGCCPGDEYSCHVDTGNE